MGLNASKIKAVKKSSNTPILAPGAYPVRIAQVIDLGLQPRKAWKGEAKAPVYQVWVTYEFPTEFMLDDDGKEEKDRPRWLGDKMNVFSMSQDNATSTKRMLAIDPANELKGDWAATIGMPVSMTVVNSKDGKYANIGGLSPVMKGTQIDELQSDGKVFDLDAPDLEVFESLPDFMKELIKTNLEFKGSKLQMMLAGGVKQVEDKAETAEGDEDAPY